MGMPIPEHTISTVEELLALPEDNSVRHELLDGEYFVTPQPRVVHQRTVLALYRALYGSVETYGDVELFGVSGDLTLGPRTVVNPDLFILQSNPEAPLESWKEAGVPLLVVEVLSPGTALRDRGTKRRLYLDCGVEEYWIVDPDARVFERWCKGDTRPEIVDAELRWSLSVGLSGTISLPDLFEQVHR